MWARRSLRPELEDAAEAGVGAGCVFRGVLAVRAEQGIARGTEEGTAADHMLTGGPGPEVFAPFADIARHIGESKSVCRKRADRRGVRVVVLVARHVFRVEIG